MPINTQLDHQLRHLRHELHAHPELSHQEVETTKRLKQKLEDAGIRILDIPLKTGLVAQIDGAHPGPLVVLRADIDALPIHEETELEFVSQNSGVMHACGHDFHAAALFGAALLLKEKAADLSGSVRLLFQPAEETGLGAPDIIKAGVLDGASAIFGLHNDPNIPVGVLASKDGVLTASVDRFEIKITAKGSHAARPHEGNDPVIIIGQIINAVQSVISRNVASENNAIVSITHVKCGNTWNVIADTAYLEGTVRTLSKPVREQIEARLRQIITGISIAFDAKIEFIWHPGPPSVTNTAYWVDLALTVAAKLGYQTKIIEKPWLGGEDFAFYQEKIPGAFVLIGSGGPYALHHPKFQIDDNALFPAAQYLAEIARSSLDKLKSAR